MRHPIPFLTIRKFSHERAHFFLSIDFRPTFAKVTPLFSDQLTLPSKEMLVAFTHTRTKSETYTNKGYRMRLRMIREKGLQHRQRVHIRAHHIHFVQSLLKEAFEVDEPHSDGPFIEGLLLAQLPDYKWEAKVQD